MNHCKTCRWWRRQTSVMKRHCEAGDCTSPALREVNHLAPDDAPDSWASVKGSGFALTEPSSLLVGPDFGCVHHEPAEEKPS